jgi:hypothetical protein
VPRGSPCGRPEGLGGAEFLTASSVKDR